MTPPRSLDTAIAEALAYDPGHPRVVAVRRAVCDWLREDEGAVLAIELADTSARDALDALLSYMEGTDTKEGTG